MEVACVQDSLDHLSCRYSHTAVAQEQRIVGVVGGALRWSACFPF